MLYYTTLSCFTKFIKLLIRMLQKGFLKPKETEKTTRAAKRNRMLFFLGLLLIIFALIYMMGHSLVRSDVIVGLCMLIAGFCIASVSMWMKFFSQNKKTKR